MNEMKNIITNNTEIKPIWFDVITISKNCSNVITKTLSSVSSQTYNYINHIIIDGNSLDDTLKIIQEFNHQKNVAIYQQKPMGIANAFNTGLTKSQGDLVIFLNSGDSFASEDVIAKLVDNYYKNNWLWAVGETISVSRHRYLRRHIKQYNSWKDNLFLYGNPICHQSTIYSQKLLKTVGLYDEKLYLGMDYDFNIRASFTANPYLLYFPISYYDTSGISSIKVYQGFYQYKKIRKKYFPTNNINDFLLDSVYLFKAVKRSLMIPFKLLL